MDTRLAARALNALPEPLRSECVCLNPEILRHDDLDSFARICRHAVSRFSLWRIIDAIDESSGEVKDDYKHAILDEIQKFLDQTDRPVGEAVYVDLETAWFFFRNDKSNRDKMRDLVSRARAQADAGSLAAELLDTLLLDD